MHAKHSSVHERLSVDDPNQALRLIMPDLSEMSGHEPAGTSSAELYSLFADVAQALWRQPVAALARDAAQSEDPNVHYALGHLLIDVGRHDLAAMFLADSSPRFSNDRALLEERVAALELLGRHADAVRALDESPAPRGLLGRALHAHNSALLGDISSATEAIQTLNAGDDPRAEHLLARLRRVVSRAGHLTFADGSRSFSINTGGLWLSASEADDWHSVSAGVALLSAALHAWKLHPRTVLAGPGDASAGYAAAVGQALRLPVKPWFGEPEAGLVVAFELSSLGPELRSALHARVPGQLFHVHAAERGSEHGVCPDFVAVRPTTSVEPWAEEDDGPFGGADEPPDADEWADELDLRLSVELPKWIRAWSTAPPNALPSALTDAPRDRLWVGA